MTWRIVAWPLGALFGVSLAFAGVIRATAAVLSIPISPDAAGATVAAGALLGLIAAFVAGCEAYGRGGGAA